MELGLLVYFRIWYREKIDISINMFGYVFI